MHMSDIQRPSKERVLAALRDGDRCRNYGPDRTENEDAIVVLADEIERLHRELIKIRDTGYSPAELKHIVSAVLDGFDVSPAHEPETAPCPTCAEACEMLGRAGISDGDLIDKVGDAIETMERAAQPPAASHSAEHLKRFTDWLVREMPAGTVIGDPAWWARKLLAAACVFADEAPDSWPPSRSALSPCGACRSCGTG
jgi:hypothetical protein